MFNQFGDVERCVLRRGNVHSSDGWRALLEPVIARYRSVMKHLCFRGDAAFSNPEVYEFLRASALECLSRRPRLLFARGDGDRPLPRPVRSAMLAVKAAVSGESGIEPYLFL
jgi:hypothetical protein